MDFLQIHFLEAYVLDRHFTPKDVQIFAFLSTQRSTFCECLRRRCQLRGCPDPKLMRVNINQYSVITYFLASESVFHHYKTHKCPGQS